MKVILSRPRNVWPDWLSCVMYQNTGKSILSFDIFQRHAIKLHWSLETKIKAYYNYYVLSNWNVFGITFFSTYFIISIWNRNSPLYTCNDLCKWNLSFSISLHEEIVHWKCAIWYLSVWMLHHL